jgi:tetratricopeptide (TPR) repeat protein
MSLKEIEKLKEKVEKDPNSKLFVPLAEEYRKEGLLDDAINVLIRGLERQPSYTSARVSLGKIYIEKGMLDEARGEFEKVISSIPDNLYAHKKLAEIYRDTGEGELAINSFKTVLRLNPMDEDALNQLKDIEGIEMGVQEQEEAQLGETPLTSDADVLGETSEAFDETAAQEVVSEDVTSEAEPEVSEEIFEVSEEDVATGDIEEALGSEVTDTEKVSEEVVSEDVTSEEEPEVSEETFEVSEEDVSFGDIEEALGSEVTDTEEVSEEDVSSGDVEEVLGVSEKPTGDISEKVTEEVKEKVEVDKIDVDTAREEVGYEEADKYISSGNYAEAINVYSSMLSSNPDDKELLQRVEDLKALLKLMGGDKEVLISKLNLFLEGINKRRDEFFGRS